MLNTEYVKNWHVYFAKAKRDHKQNVDYLGRYIKRPPLAQSRLQHYNGHCVIFRYLNHRTKEQDIYTCSSSDFIERLTQHIPDKYFKMIRYYGFLSYRVRGTLLPKVYAVLKQTIKENKKVTFADLFAANFRDNPMQCILCKSLMLVRHIQPEIRLKDLMPHHKALATMRSISHFTGLVRTA